MNTKQALRNYWLEKRSNLTEFQKNNLSLAIQELLFSEYPIQKADYVHIFLPAMERGEVRTWSMIQYLFDKLPHVNVCAPRIIDAKNKKMESILLERTTHYSKNIWGIDEPENGSVVQPAMLDVILMPLLQFDTKGHRLGYGGGFYDRYLASCTKATKIGLSFFEPINEVPEINEFDIKMDYCITPIKKYSF